MPLSIIKDSRSLEQGAFLKRQVHEDFHAVVLRHAQAVVQVGRGLVPFEGALPEFPVVAAREERHVFLALVLENGHFLLLDLVGSKGHDESGLFDLPLLPGPSVHEHPALVRHFLQGTDHS